MDVKKTRHLITKGDWYDKYTDRVLASKAQSKNVVSYTKTSQLLMRTSSTNMHLKQMLLLFL